VWNGWRSCTAQLYPILIEAGRRPEYRRYDTAVLPYWPNGMAFDVRAPWAKLPELEQALCPVSAERSFGVIAIPAVAKPMASLPSATRTRIYPERVGR